MIDNTIKRINVWFRNDMVNEFPKPVLPEGFKFVLYKDCEKDKRRWADILNSVGYFEPGIEAGVKCFNSEFVSRIKFAEERMFFIVTDAGEYVGTCTAWQDDRLHRGVLHWLGVRPEYQKYGLGKALVDMGLYTFHTKLEGWPVYLLTQTSSHIAMCLYLKRGFYPVYQDDESRKEVENAVEVLKGVMRDKDYQEFASRVKDDRL